MADFKRGDIVKVPFPYTDRATRQSRPALVISGPGLEDSHGLLWVLMVTSAENRGWPGDVGVTHLATAGLPVASVIRTAKVATIDAGAAVRLGSIAAATLRKVLQRLAETAGLVVPEKS